MALAPDRRERAIEVPVISVEPIRASDLVDLAVGDSQDFDCRELENLAVADPQHLDETPSRCDGQLGLDDRAASSRLTEDPRLLSLEVAPSPPEEPWLVYL